MSELHDPLAEIRDLLGSPRPVVTVHQDEFALRETIGVQPRFKGNQEIRVIAVGNTSLK